MIDWSSDGVVALHAMRSTVPGNLEFGTFITQEAITTTTANGDATFKASSELDQGIGAKKISELIAEAYGPLAIDVTNRQLIAWDVGEDENVTMLDWSNKDKLTASVPVAPAHLADGDAPNDTLYYSTTASKLVYKDPGGVVRALY